MTMKIKESELKALLEEVASDLSKAFESEKDKLVKAEEVEKSALAKDDAPGEKTPDEEPSAEPSAPPAADASAPPSPEEGSESAPPADPSASPDGAPSPDASMDPAADAAAALTPEALQAEYSKLAPEELDMHLKAALAAKAAIAGAPDASAGAPPMAPPDASAPPLAPPAAPAPGPSAPPAGPPLDPMALKSEISAGSKKASGGQIKAGGSLGKSENEKATDDKIAALEALVKSQSEDTENLAKALKLMLEQPLRKAVTSVAHLPKVEVEKAPLTKASINARLKELSMKPDLKKSDRALINDFYDGRVKADALAPLFEDYK